MTLNLRKQATQKSNPTQMKSDFMSKHKITVNQPTQAHFSVEGVQAYSPQEIAALKLRQERVNANAQKEGEYIKVQAYKIDDELQYLDRPTTANDEMRQTLKLKKSKKVQLQEAKPQKSKVKPSIRNQLGRANQKFVKREKDQQKKDQYQKKLQELKQQYKKHFGDEIKAKNKKKQKQKVKDEQQADSKQANEFQMDEQEGDQCLPTQFNKEKSIKTMTKTQKQNKDDSFQQVEWQQKPSSLSIRSSRMNASTYSQKLGNAVHSLFD